MIYAKSFFPYVCFPRISVYNTFPLLGCAVSFLLVSELLHTLTAKKYIFIKLDFEIFHDSLK